MKIKRRRTRFKPIHIFLILFIFLITISTAYAYFSTELVINGTATGEREKIDIFYYNIENSEAYPSSVWYMETFSYTFANPPTIEVILMEGRRLTLGTDYTYSDNGTLTIPNVTGTLLINGEEIELEDFKIKYVYGDNIYFDGSTILDTGIAMFNNENWGRDFELTVNIDNCIYNGSQNSGLNTIFNCVDHKNKPYHGFLLRRDSSKYRAKVTTSANNVAETTYNLNSIQNVRLARTNNKLYANYSNSSNLTQVGDFSGLTSKINYNLFFGSDVDGTMTPFRCFKGVMSNISITNFYQADEAPITLPSPSRTGYNFSGWFSDSNLTNRIGYGDVIYSPTGDTTLYAKWTQIQDIDDDEELEEYIYNGTYNFAQEDYINTHVYLYNQKNIHRNFEMSFNIDSLGTSVNHDTIMSATKNIFKISDSTNHLTTLITNGNTAISSVVDIPNTITNVRLLRINDNLYYSFNNQDFLLINEYTNDTSYSNKPVLFGADFKSDDIIYRVFDGILSDIKVRFIGDNVTLADYANPTGTLATVYSHPGNYVFDGTNNIDTNIKLFDYVSYSKDFEISFNIESIDSTIDRQATIVNSKYENLSKGYPGFVYRLDTDKVKLELTAAKATSGTPYSTPIADVHSVKISKRDMKLYIKVNDEAEVQVYDFSGFKDFFSTKVTIGSSIDENGDIFRPFKGVLSNIVVKLEQ